LFPSDAPKEPLRDRWKQYAASTLLQNSIAGVRISSTYSMQCGDRYRARVPYLASSEAAFVTGASLKIDGGLTA
jgi:NAD(P)-dependent dehydrogenase (short-subunit alcohol dehydrogenase family)